MAFDVSRRALTYGRPAAGRFCPSRRVGEAHSAASKATASLPCRAIVCAPAARAQRPSGAGSVYNNGSDRREREVWGALGSPCAGVARSRAQRRVSSECARRDSRAEGLIDELRGGNDTAGRLP